MARQIIVLALIFVAVVGSVVSAAQSPASAPSKSESPKIAPTASEVAPVSSPSSDSEDVAATPSASPKSSAEAPIQKSPSPRSSISLAPSDAPSGSSDLRSPPAPTPEASGPTADAPTTTADAPAPSKQRNGASGLTYSAVVGVGESSTTHIDESMYDNLQNRDEMDYMHDPHFYFPQTQDVYINDESFEPNEVSNDQEKELGAENNQIVLALNDHPEDHSVRGPDTSVNYANGLAY
ncbi:classical arabinogalactan protein 11-like [Papaver somniferum]|uniref:classical arabinogalactan protein 11-like n=1 Tax=Papaver somniferum TaxID=3469 RepID=UPI000E6FDC03|nr:classical arabinogalactan protein 11-like [Papaver somniferum]